MSLIVNRKTFYEIVLPLDLTGLESGRFARTPFFDNTNYGFESIFFQLKYRSGTSDPGSANYLTLYFGESGNGGDMVYYRNLGYSVFQQDDEATVSVWVGNIPPYWCFGVVNNSDAALDDDPTSTSFVVMGVMPKEIDQNYISYVPTGRIGFQGDATETVFPFVIFGGGRLFKITGDMAIPAQYGVGAIRFGGVATIQTDHTQIATGGFTFQGIGSGPAPAP